MALMNLLCFLFFNGFGQQITFDEAAKMTIENNYGVLISKKEVQLATNNTSRENNGYYPTVNFTGGGSYDLGSSTQKFGNGSENQVQNAGTIGGNASVSVNYDIYDKTRSTVLIQWKELLNLTDLQLRQTIESSLVQLAENYFNIARLTTNLAVLLETMEVSKRRLQRVQYQYEYGQGLRLDVLNAEVDVQRDSINILNIQQQLDNTKRNLNLIMGREVDQSFLIDTAVTYDVLDDLSSLLTAAEKNNVAVMLLEKNQDVALLDLDIINATKSPIVSTTASYRYNFQDSPDGAFISFSTSRGLGLGVNVAWNLFDGGLRKVRTANTRINLESLAIQREEIKQQIRLDVINAWENLQNARQVLKVEASNLATNKLNLSRTEQQFNLGQITSVEFRQAQLNLLDAQTSYNAAKYNAKMIEVLIKQLIGKIIA